MHTFQIVTTDGRDLGPMTLGRPDWRAGSVIYGGGPRPNLRFVERREANTGAILAVEEVKPKTWGRGSLEREQRFRHLRVGGPGCWPPLVAGVRTVFGRASTAARSGTP